jgi:L-alanine-DL-glutamate epimerase-like enolase superfamily enzyme
MLLGGSRSRVPLLAVAGYFSEIRSREDIEDEIRALVASGYRALKVPIEGRDPRGDAKYVAQLQRAAGKSVAFGVDTHMAWNSVPEALESVRPLDDLGLAFIEDPFPPDRWRLTQELQERLQTPIAVGEDALHLDEFRNLIEAATILRVDATASGGIGVVLDAIALGAAAGRGLMTHSFPELHGQIAGGVAAIELVEMLPYGAGANPVGELLYRRQQVVEGQLVLDEEPGHGMFIDWDAVLKHARRVSTVGSSSS